MKIYLPFLTFLVFFAGCSKENDDENICTNCGGAVNTSTYIRANINGSQFNSSKAESCILYDDMLLPGMRMLLMIAESNNHKIFLGLMDSSIGTEILDTVEYSFTGSTHFALFDYGYITATDTIIDCPNISGWLKISHQDTVTNKISGSFEFTVIDDDHNNDTIKVTNGVFSKIKYDVIN